MCLCCVPVLCVPVLCVPVLCVCACAVCACAVCVVAFNGVNINKIKSSYMIGNLCTFVLLHCELSIEMKAEQVQCSWLMEYLPSPVL